MKKRNEYLDIVKAWAIIFVVGAHCIQFGSGNAYLTNELFFENVLFRAIYSFHMPLFMLVSGYLFAYSMNKKEWTSVIVAKMKLINPVLIWAIIPFVAIIIKQYHQNETVSLAFCLKTYVYVSLKNLWFLWAIFWCSLIVCVVRRFFKDNVLIFLLGLLITFITPDVLDMALYKYMYPYFIIGYLFNIKKGKERLTANIQSNIIVVIFGALFIGLLFFYNHDTFIYNSGYSILKTDMIRQIFIDVYRFIIGLIGSVFVMLIIGKLNNCLGDKVRMFLYIGRNTMGIYIISGYFSQYVLYRITYKISTINYLLLIIETIIVLSFSLLCTGIIKKNAILSKILLGGK